jgi:hypothetical protein
MTCLRCEHFWESRKKGGLPAQCPHCKSPYWNTPRQYQRVMRDAVRSAPAGAVSVSIQTPQGTKVAEQSVRETVYERDDYSQE